MIAPWIPVTVVPTSSATVAIETFITDVSSAIRNCPEASMSRTRPLPAARAALGTLSAVIAPTYPAAPIP